MPTFMLPLNPILWDGSIPDPKHLFDTKDYFVFQLDSDEFATLPLDPNGRGMLITGRGRRKDDTCGEIKASYSTPNHRRVHVHNCKQQQCPECGMLYAAKAARQASLYLTGFALFHSTKLFHAVISQKPEDFTTLDDLLAKFRLFAEDLHRYRRGEPLGYMTVFHPYRLKCANCHAPDAEHPFEVNPHAPCLNCGAEHAYWWEFSPHVHLITNFYINLRGDNNARKNHVVDLQNRFKFIYHNISQDQRRAVALSNARAAMRGIEKHSLPPGFIPSMEALYGIIKYECGHAFMDGKHNTIRYFGGMKKGFLKVRPTVKERRYARDDENELFLKEFSHGNGRILRVARDPNDNAFPHYQSTEIGKQPIHLVEVVPKQIWVHQTGYSAVDVLVNKFGAFQTQKIKSNIYCADPPKCEYIGIPKMPAIVSDDVRKFFDTPVREPREKPKKRPKLDRASSRSLGDDGWYSKEIALCRRRSQGLLSKALLQKLLDEIDSPLPPIVECASPVQENRDAIVEYWKTHKVTINA